MGKKKKKTKSGPGEAKDESIALTDHANHQESHHETEPALCLRMIQNELDGKTKGEGCTVLMHPEDMNRIQVSNGDRVVLMLANDPVSALVAKVRMTETNSTPSPSLHRPRLPSFRIKQPGEIRVSPQYFNSSNTDMASNQKIPIGFLSSPLSTPSLSSSIAQPSTPFSFDKLRRQQIAVSTPPPTQESHSIYTIVCPIQSALGKRILRHLAKDATKIEVYPCPSPSTQQFDRDSSPFPIYGSPSKDAAPDAEFALNTLSNGQMAMLNVLIKSHFARSTSPLETDRFLPNPRNPNFHANAMTFSLSFQGKFREFRIVDCHSLSYADPALELQDCMENLSINHEIETKIFDPTSLIEKILKSRSDTVSLYRISKATNILLRDCHGVGKYLDTKTIVHEQIQQHDFQLVAGVDSILRKIHSILTPSIFPSQSRSTLAFPKGLLLYGATGVGKTSLAKHFANQIKQQSKSLQQEVRVEFHHCSSLAVSSILGESEHRISSIYRAAERRAYQSQTSTLIVLDDVHLLCPRRGNGGTSSGSDRLASTLLAILDGISPQLEEDRDSSSPKGNVVTLAITRTPSLLDPALRRPGRLDRELEIPIPDDVAREQILKFQLRQIQPGQNSSLSGLDLEVHPRLLDDNNDIVKRLGRLAKGFTGADTHLALKECCRTMLLRRMEDADNNYGNFVTEEDLRAAIASSKPSTLREVAVQVPTVHWEDIGGMDHVKQELREAIEWPLAYPQLFSEYGIDPPKGLLLYGPPGCSKTLMARALATEGQMNFLAVKGPELLSKWLGESERALAALFRRARQASPCVIFFDEVDAIAGKRGGTGGGERLLSQLLTELDGVGTARQIASKSRVVVCCATNRPDLLDPALTRPGRIDRMIYVGVPDRESRIKILSLSLKHKLCEDDVDIETVALDEYTGGFSGAELVAICRDAAFSAIEESEESNLIEVKIGMRHLLKSIADTDKQITPEMISFYNKFRERPS